MLLLVACDSTSPTKQIDAMQKRVDVVERRVEVLYNQDFNYLVGEYKALDTTVALEKDIQAEMELLRAYLQQFEDQRVVIKDDVEFSRQQLSDLKHDIKKHLYDDETTAEYLKDEEDAIRMMEAQIKYFQEKFDSQKEVVKQLRKE